MKVGILTFQYADNYGAVMQAMALAQTVKELGYDVNVIDYRPDSFSGLYEPRFRPKEILYGNTLQAIIRHSRFNQFRNRYLGLSVKIYRSRAELDEIGALYDIILIGSDQVWNANLLKEGVKAYLLPFTSGKARLSSYAASFGGTKPDVSYFEDFKKSLEKYDFLSAREDICIDFIRNNFNLDIVRTVDPVLLLDFQKYSELFSLGQGSFDLSVYCMGYASFSIIEDYIKTSKMKAVLFRGWEKFGTVIPFLGRWVSGVGFQKSVKPIDWFRSITSAKYVYTDSFHGTLFSILARRQFIVCTNDERIIGLLRRFGLVNRRIPVGSEVDFNTLFHESIDYENTFHIIEEERNNSLNYLRKVVEKE